MLLGTVAAYSKSGKSAKNTPKPEKTCAQKCSDRYSKAMEACKLKKGKPADKCKKAAQTKKDKCSAACKK
ncbi:MAG TPA: hypothetical protein DCZ92_05650 [Elusimicrobia bacterium]|nr:MAG: hypothetical protein A2016_06855 [Elusimicrobia bacterium GWF2_62_30]HBA60290.1 hypothetical protein [Elusimicrobiota bacterium]